MKKSLNCLLVAPVIIFVIFLGVVTIFGENITTPVFAISEGVEVFVGPNGCPANWKLIDNKFYQYPVNTSLNKEGRDLNPGWVLEIYDELDNSDFEGWVQLFPLDSGELRVVLKDDSKPPVVLDSWGGRNGRVFSPGTLSKQIAKTITEFEG